VVELATMNERTGDIPEQVRKFAPKQKPRNADDPTDMAGHALVAMLQQAADLSNDNCNQALKVVDNLYDELRASEDRVRQLEAEIEFHRDRAERCENWLRRIQKEVEESLIARRGKQPPPQT
jgi:chromosome segregation ATPase